jgi:toxin ParE1/3/4
VRIRWLDQAFADVRAIRKYIAEDNPDAAAEVAGNLRRAAAILASYPAAGRPGRLPHTRELVVTGTPYVLPYRVRNGVIEILRVLHGSRKWPQP